MKLETEIRNLKKELDQTRALCIRLGAPPILAYLPSAVLKSGDNKLDKSRVKWLKAKIREYNELFPDLNIPEINPATQEFKNHTTNE